jgi:hypothetical protein
LNLIVWEGCARQGYEAHQELQRYMMDVFIQEHRGYLWKEVIGSQLESPGRLEFALRTGGLLWDPHAGHYTSSMEGGASDVVSKPHIVGISREAELRRQGDWAGSWVGAVFDYHCPILGFNRSEQRLLSAALQGSTDEQLVETLGTSLPP